MAELNFNLLNPPGSENIANAFVKGMDQSRAERRSDQAMRMQEAQLQQSLREGQMKEAQFAKLQREEQALNQFYGHARSKGAPNDPLQMEEMMIGSGVPDIVKTGITARMKRLDIEAARKQAQEAMFLGGAASSQSALPAAAPGDLLGLGNQMMPTNSLAPAAEPVSNALTAPRSNDRQSQVTEAKRLMASGVPAAVKAGEIMLQEAIKPERLYPIGNNLVSGTGGIVATVPEKAPTPSKVSEYKFAQSPEGGGFKGSYQDFITAQAKAGRAPVQPVAPTITQIQDPKDPTRMITIDARRYQGGGLGDSGVIGASGKTPKATADAMKVEAGQSAVSDIIDNIRTSYQALDKQRAIPSTQRGALSNLGSSIQASGVGQTAGRVFGTSQQSERDVIASSRIQLLNAIKQATGMSAQQLNSNVELNTWLKAVTDPSQSIEAVSQILDNIEEFVAKGGKPKTSQPAKPLPAGSVVDFGSLK